MVSGPMVGKSARRSWPGLTDFTNTPAGFAISNASSSGPQRDNMASVPSTASTATTTPAQTTQPWPTSTEPSGPDDCNTPGDIGHGVGIGGGARQQTARTQCFMQDFVGAKHAKPFLAQHADNRREQAVVAGESGTADPGEHLGALSVRPDVQQRRPAHWTDQHQILAAMLAQRAKNAAHRAHAQEDMRPGRDDVALGKTLQADDEHRPPGGGCGGGDPAR